MGKTKCLTIFAASSGVTYSIVKTSFLLHGCVNLVWSISGFILTFLTV